MPTRRKAFWGCLCENKIEKGKKKQRTGSHFFFSDKQEKTTPGTRFSKNRENGAESKQTYRSFNTHIKVHRDLKRGRESEYTLSQIEERARTTSDQLSNIIFVTRNEDKKNLFKENVKNNVHRMLPVEINAEYSTVLNSILEKFN